jgi:hypothetical protein
VPDWVFYLFKDIHFNNQANLFCTFPESKVMGRRFILYAGITLVCCLNIAAQQNTALEYWKMEQDSAYKSLQQRQLSGDSLSQDELDYTSEFQLKLKTYFSQLSDEELASYYRNRKNWSEPQLRPVNTVIEEGQVFAGDKSTYSQYLASSGTYGFFYGWACDYLFNIQDETAIGLPLVTAGASLIFPIVSIKDRKVNTNSLMLSLHGKAIGAYQGAMLGLLIGGDNMDSESYGKLTVGLSLASSIGLGHAGYALGKTKPWSEGRVGLYRHYGWLIPLEGMAIDFAFEIDNPRVYAATSLVMGAGGYLLADRIANKIDFSRGDILAMQTFTLMNGMLGLGIMNDLNDPAQSAILFPAVTTLAGTIAGQWWLRDTQLTMQQGRIISLATPGGYIIGLGLAVMMNLKSGAPYYILPYITGFTTYAMLVESYKKKNGQVTGITGPGSPWQFNFMPQNILINQKIANSVYAGRASRLGMLPAFSASLRF